MSALIKSTKTEGADQRVRPFGVASRPAATNAPSRETVLEARIVELQATLETHEAELPAKLERAREEGAREALEERSKAEAEALAALRAALKDALSLWSERLSDWNGAAAGIAKAVLEQVFTGAEHRSELVEATIRKRVAVLDANSVVRIRVSAEDFADSKAFARTVASVGQAVELKSDSSLKTGECIVDLKLGHVDLGLGSQWGRIAGLLESLERDGLEP